MRQMSSAKIADRYVAGMQGASTAYKEGVNAVSVAPGALAVQQQEKLLRKFTESVNSGQWASRTGSVPLDTWKNLAATKGANNLAGGAIAAKNKVQAYWNSALPEYQALMARIESMPSATDSDMEARALEWMRGMKAWKARRSG